MEKNSATCSEKCQSLPKLTLQACPNSFLSLLIKCFLLPYGLIKRKSLVRDLLKRVLPLLKAQCICKCIPETLPYESVLQVWTAMESQRADETLRSCRTKLFIQNLLIYYFYTPPFKKFSFCHHLFHYNASGSTPIAYFSDWEIRIKDWRRVTYFKLREPHIHTFIKKKKIPKHLLVLWTNTSLPRWL